MSGFKRNLAGEEVEPVEAVLIAKNGRRLEVIITAETIRVRGGIGIIGIITDVSGVKRLEKEVEEGQEHIQLYMDAMAVLVVVIDSSGNVIAVNRKTADVLGYGGQEMVGKSWFNTFMPPDSRASRKNDFERVMAGLIDDVTNLEGLMLCRSGQEKMIRWYITRVRDADGKIIANIGCGLDMAQEKALESNLIESESKYRNLFENSPIGIFRTTPDGRVLIANPALVRMLGFSSFEELATRNIDKNGHHPDTPRKLFIDKIERDGEVVGFESKWLKRDGSVMHARENATAVRDSQGKTVYYEGTVEDVTRQKENQEELYYRLHFERLIASVSTRFVNIDARLVDQAIDRVLQEIGEFEGVDSCRINQFSKTGKQIARTHGWRKSEGDETIGEKTKQTIDLHPWTLKKLWRGEVVQLSRTSRLTQRKINAEAEYEYMERQGIQSLLCIPFRMYGQEKGLLILAAEHQERTWSPDTISLLRVICEIFSAALELKFTAMELEKERMLMNILMDTIPDHIYFKDKQSRFIRINKAMAKDFGMTSPEVAVGKNDSDIFSAEHAKQAFKDEQEVMRTGRPIVAKEEKETWPDGLETWVSTTKMPMYNEKEEIVGTFGISRDISVHRRMEQERHELELKIQYAQKLESLSLLSGTIAHDFNNLLMGILGHTSLALMELTNESPAWESVKQIETTALCAAELTNQMLTYAGKSKVTLQSLNLASLVREMSHLLEVSISKKVKLIYNFDDTGTLIEGDSAQIRQVVMNLIINASDAIGNKMGTINVSTGLMPYDPVCFSKCYVRLDEPVAESYAYVEVKDSGCGMDKATIGRMFEPFFTTKATGRGLGLAAIMGIMRSHKGGLCVESEVGKGTTFHVFFPVSTRQAQAENSGERQRPMERHRHGARG